MKFAQEHRDTNNGRQNRMDSLDPESIQQIPQTNHSMVEEDLNALTPIQKFYNGKSVFITGGSGFVGKALLEKLLRSCPGISKIYILIRSKKGKSPEERINDIFSSTIFDELKKRYPKFLEKIVAIPGDCCLSNLGLTKDHLQLLIDNVNIVFHVAATVRFDETLKVAVGINVVGTEGVISLCHSVKNLESFVHVSTAFSICPWYNVKEKVCDWTPFFDKALKMTKELNKDELESKTPAILWKWPNTYTFTKALAECLVKETEGKLPVCIFRPAIVTSTANEPIPGWVDNYLGATGIITGAGLGLIRVIHCDRGVEANLVPVDFVVNALLAAAYETYRSFRRAEKAIKVYNYVSCNENPLSYETFQDTTEYFGKQIPSEKCIWYFCLFSCRSKYLVNILGFFLHLLPAFIADVVSVLCGKKPEKIKLYGKIQKMIHLIGYFSSRRWVYDTHNVISLWDNVSEADRKIFNFDIKSLDWREYLKHYMSGIRNYVLKEDMTTLKYALKKWKRLYWYHQALKTIFGLLFISILWYSFRSVTRITYVRV